MEGAALATLPDMESRIVIMGPSGSGKSLVGAALAARLRGSFIDGDDLHPAANVAKMSSGTALTDEDRLPWLRAVAQAVAGKPPVVVACSALRRSYRDAIRQAVPDTWFVELVVPSVELTRRMSKRDHFMPPSLLDSQLATLEPLAGDEAGVRVANDAGLDDVVARILRLSERHQSLR